MTRSPCQNPGEGQQQGQGQADDQQDQVGAFFTEGQFEQTARNLPAIQWKDRHQVEERQAEVGSGQADQERENIRVD